MESTLQSPLSADQFGTLEPLTSEHDAIGSILPEGDMLAGERLTAIVRDDRGVVTEVHTERVAEAPVHVLAGIDDDLTADLAAIGVDLTPGGEVAMEDARRQAYAAVLFRRVQRINREIAETARARDLEVEMVHAHYERQLAGPRATLFRLLSFIETLAQLTTWGKKRSHATPYGTFGVRKKAPTVELTDPAATLAWAREQQPDVVRITVSLSLVEARQYFTDAEIEKHKVSLEWGALKKTLSPDEALPPGVAAVDGGDEPFAKPDEG